MTLLAQLSARLAELGRPILPNGISRIEQGERRVDVDDLVALALALDVSPNALLMPDKANRNIEIKLTSTFTVSASDVWNWACGKTPFLQPMIKMMVARELHEREQHDAVGARHAVEAYERHGMTLPVAVPETGLEYLAHSGLLWLINRTVFHPIGFALVLVQEPDGAAVSIQILGDGTEPISFDEEDDFESFRTVQATLRELRASSRYLRLDASLRP